MSKQVFKNLTGETFGRLTVVTYAGRTKGGKPCWYCQCDCEQEKTTITDSYTLLNGESNSCGCLLIEHYKNYKKHGKHNSSEYGIWNSMLQRCNNHNNAGYKYYGGRGIKVCEEWLDFQNFYNDMGERPSSEYSIDRKDNDGNYCKENCYWATKKEQTENKRNSVIITFNNKTQSLKDWSNELNLNYKTLLDRLKRGWSVEKTLSIIPIKTQDYSKRKMK